MSTVLAVNELMSSRCCVAAPPHFPEITLPVTQCRRHSDFVFFLFVFFHFIIPNKLLLPLVKAQHTSASLQSKTTPPHTCNNYRGPLPVSASTTCIASLKNHNIRGHTGCVSRVCVWHKVMLSCVSQASHTWVKRGSRGASSRGLESRLLSLWHTCGSWQK